MFGIYTPVWSRQDITTSLAILQTKSQCLCCCICENSKQYYFPLPALTSLISNNSRVYLQQSHAVTVVGMGIFHNIIK